MSEGPPTFDLQSHSRHSDGELSAAEVVSTAASVGVELLSLTDHDTVDGVSEAAAAARDAGIRLVSGVEISAVDDAGPDLHILGYLIDERDPKLLERLAEYRGDRERRASEMIGRLRELGFELDETPLERRKAAGKSIGRPHIARAAAAHPANAERLEDEGISHWSAFLKAYLVEGAPGFARRRVPSVVDAVGAIHAAGGVAVWAHPFWDISDPQRVLEAIDRFRADGIDGIECFYLTHTAEETALLIERCREETMLATGSSDFHGPQHRQMSEFRAFRTYGLEPYLGPIASSASK